MGTQRFSSTILRDGGHGSETVVPADVLIAEMPWLHVHALPSHYFTFITEEKHFGSLKEAVNGRHWLQNVAGIAGALISPHLLCCVLLKIYQILHLFT